MKKDDRLTFQTIVIPTKENVFEMDVGISRNDLHKEFNYSKFRNCFSDALSYCKIGFQIGGKPNSTCPVTTVQGQLPGCQSFNIVVGRRGGGGGVCVCVCVSHVHGPRHARSSAGCSPNIFKDRDRIP